MRDRVTAALRAARQALYGMTTFGWAQAARREQAERERVFMLVTFGGLLGIPLYSPYYALRLLPYLAPSIFRRLQAMLRERDWSDLAELVDT